MNLVSLGKEGLFSFNKQSWTQRLPNPETKTSIFDPENQRTKEILITIQK